MKKIVLLFSVIFIFTTSLYAKVDAQTQLNKLIKKEEVLSLDSDAIGGNHTQLFLNYITLAKGETVEIIDSKSIETPDVVTIYKANKVPRITIVKYKDEKGKLQSIEYMLFDEKGAPMDSEYGIDFDD